FPHFIRTRRAAPGSGRSVCCARCQTAVQTRSRNVDLVAAGHTGQFAGPAKCGLAGRNVVAHSARSAPLMGAILGILPPGMEWKVRNRGKGEVGRVVLLVAELVLDILKVVR